MIRHDPALQAVLSASAEIRNPTILWSFDLRGDRASFSIRPGTGENRVVFDLGAESLTERSKRPRGEWEGSRPPMFTLSPDGSLTQSGHPNNERVADFFPDIPGLEKFVMPDQFKENIELARGQMFKHENGIPEQVWETEEIHTHYAPLVLLADATGDGTDEIVMAIHYRLFVFDPQTGKTLMQLRYHDFRNYGFFGAKNLDGDPQAEFVNIGDFSSHIDVLKSDGENLSVIWRKDIESNIDRKKKIVRPGPDPIRDLDGDGRYELVFNFHNEHGDNLWHTVAWDALTGEVVFDWPGVYLHALHDLDDDGVDEIFLSRTDGLYVPKFAPAEIARFVDGKKQTIWSLEAGRFPRIDRMDLPKDRTSGAALGAKTVPVFDWNGDGLADFAVFHNRSDGGVDLEGWLQSKEGFTKQWSVNSPLGFQAEVEAVEDDHKLDGPSILLSLDLPRSGPSEHLSLDVAGVQMELLSVRKVKAPADYMLSMEPRVGRLGGREKPTILVSGGPNEILAIAPPQGGDATPVIEWSLQGTPYFLMADVDGDERKEVVILAEGRGGEGKIVVADDQGETVWEKTLYGFPGLPEAWNIAGLTSLFAGRFSGDGKGMDLFVSARRSTMHSNEGVVLSGEDGSLLWRRESIGDEWGVGGSWIAASDLEGDGLDEILTLYPVCFSILEGRTGEERIYRNMAVDYFPGVWAAYGAPVVADWLGDGGVPEVYHALGYGAGMSNLSAERVWSATQPTAFPARFDVNGDGLPEIVACEFRSPNGGPEPRGFIARDARSGIEVSVLDWKVPNPAAAHLVTVDIDGDGGLDGVFASGNVIGAITSKDGRLEKSWDLPLPEGLSPPALADLDGDGRPEVLVYGDSGRLYVIGDAARREEE